uniref:Uncharacterized protein n=1 Tax=Romanomermis culicivorax TaxID=13658 RepID=A0A915K5I2_ROMCU
MDLVRGIGDIGGCVKVMRKSWKHILDITLRLNPIYPSHKVGYLSYHRHENAGYSGQPDCELWQKVVRQTLSKFKGRGPFLEADENFISGDTFRRIVHLKGNNRRSLSRLVKAVKKINECLPKTVDSSLDIILNDLTEEINKQKANVQQLDDKSKVLKQKIDDLSLPSPVSCDFEERKRNLQKLKKQCKDDRKDLKRHILTWNTTFFAETG